LYRFLIVDAEPETHESFQALSTAVEGELVSTFSNDEAIALLEAGERFDIALVNIDKGNGPNLNLFKTLTRRDVRVARIGLTRDGEIEKIRDAIHDGAVDILTKPISIEDATATLDRVMKTINTRRKNWDERAEYSALQREIQIAAEMQQRILPKHYPDIPGLEVYGSMSPAKIMGGDLFDVFELGPEKVGFFIGDVSGKSVPAAFYMAVARTLLRSVSDNVESPSECLEKVDALLSAHEIPGTFVTAFLGVLDTRTFECVYANAGHPLPIIVSDDGAISEIQDGRGTVLGIGAGLDYEQGALILQPDDTLLSYTDGVTEAMDIKNDPYGEERLESLLRDITDAKPSALCQRITEDVERHSAGREQHDDLTVLAVKRLKEL
jgi:sigma-B regulation protein RsbU (phosphoserine phosphatase)